MTTRMFLRVKRPRSAAPAATIRLEGLDDFVKPPSSVGGVGVDGGGAREDGSSNADFLNKTTPQEQQQEGLGVDGDGASEPAVKRSCAVWKRIDTDHEMLHRNNGVATAAVAAAAAAATKTAATTARSSETAIDPVEGIHNKRSRPVYFVADAVLEGAYNGGRSSKRRKLTIVESSHHEEFPLSLMPSGAATKHNKKSSVKKKPYAVLDPLSRLVDDNLQMLHSGNISVAEHYRFVMTDPRIAPESRKWMAWNNATGGNVLHACARWNDVEIAQDLLRNQIDGLTDAVDGDGCTPYETAQQCGHESVCQVLEAFGADTSNYVYDIFCLQKDADTTAAATATNRSVNDVDEKGRASLLDDLNKEILGENGVVEAQEEEPVSLELRGGVGYWTEDGELILEATTKDTLNTDEYQDDIDSNCEDYGGNDYPDEDEFWEEDFLYGNGGAVDEYHEYQSYGEEIDDYMAHRGENAATPDYLYD